MRFIVTAFLLLAAAVLAPVSVRASAGPVPLARDEFVGQLASQLSSHFNLEGDLQLELIRTWSTPTRVASDWAVVVTEFPTLPATSMLVRVRIVADGAVAADESILLRATLWRDAWITRQPVTLGSNFDPALLDVRRVDALREREMLPATVGDKGYVFSRAVQAGRLLTWRDVTRRPLVRKGELVDVTAAEGNLSISMKALAMQNGAAGDVVTVRNPESRRDFAALVVDENRVQVRF